MIQVRTKNPPKILSFKNFIENIRNRVKGNSSSGPTTEEIIKSAEEIKKRHQAAMKR